MQHESSRVIDGHPIATRAPRRSQIRTRTTLRHCDRRGPRRWDREDVDFYLHRGGLKVLRLGRIGAFGLTIQSFGCKLLTLSRGKAKVTHSM